MCNNRIWDLCHEEFQSKPYLFCKSAEPIAALLEYNLPSGCETLKNTTANQECLYITELIQCSTRNGAPTIKQGKEDGQELNRMKMPFLKEVMKENTNFNDYPGLPSLPEKASVPAGSWQLAYQKCQHSEESVQHQRRADRVTPRAHPLFNGRMCIISFSVLSNTFHQKSFRPPDH